MNPDVLATLARSVEGAVKKYGPQFGGVIESETTGQTPKQSNVGLAGKILDRLEQFLDPEILIVPRSELARLPLDQNGSFTDESRKAMLECIENSGEFVRRSQAETDANNVQIVSCGLLTHEEQVFVFQRKELDPKYQLYGKATIWQGSHVAKREGKAGLALLEGALMERITRSLFLSRVFPLKIVGYCWDAKDEKSNHHFGVIFRVSIDNDHTATDLRKKEFRTGRGHSLAGGFMPWKELSTGEMKLNLESWSMAILHGVKDFKG